MDTPIGKLRYATESLTRELTEELQERLQEALSVSSASDVDLLPLVMSLSAATQKLIEIYVEHKVFCALLEAIEGLQNDLQSEEGTSL
jgi:hypothetical protein